MPKPGKKTKTKRLSKKIKRDSLLMLQGSGKDIWTDERADEYIRRLRRGWK